MIPVFQHKPERRKHLVTRFVTIVSDGFFETNQSTIAWMMFDLSSGTAAKTQTWQQNATEDPPVFLWFSYDGTSIPLTKHSTPIQPEKTYSERMMRHHPLFAFAACVAADSWFHRTKVSLGHIPIPSWKFALLLDKSCFCDVKHLKWFLLWWGGKGDNADLWMKCPGCQNHGTRHRRPDALPAFHCKLFQPARAILSLGGHLDCKRSPFFGVPAN